MRTLGIVYLLVFYQPVASQVFTPSDSISRIYFKVKNFGVPVEGTFKGLAGTITFDEVTLSQTHFDVTLAVNTINTNLKMRDAHLSRKEYFNTAEFPIIRFVSTHVKTLKGGEGLVTGMLTIKKISKGITFPFQYSVTNGVPSFKGEFEINRIDFALGSESISLSDEVRVIIEVRTLKQKE